MGNLDTDSETASSKQAMSIPEPGFTLADFDKAAEAIEFVESLTRNNILEHHSPALSNDSPDLPF